MSRAPLPNGLAALAALAVLVIAGVGHVGSPDVYFRGAAGPYDVGVVIRPPGVVPGQVEVVVQLSNEPAAQVTVQPVLWETGADGAPPPDVARPVLGEPGAFATRLWLMTSGSYSIRVVVRGARGTGTVDVPVVSAATRELPLSPALGALLLALGAFLVFGLLSIIGAGAREATLDPGAPVDAPRRRRSRVAVCSAAAIFALALLGGNAWWNRSARAYRRIIYKPLASRVSLADSGRVLEFVITDSRWRQREETPLVRDHGKLVHFFLIRAPGMDAFAHLHPVTSDSNDFRVALPPLPAGTYHTYADIVHRSGYAETLVDTVVIDGQRSPSFSPTDSDDSWIVSGASTPASDAQRRATLADGSIMSWDRGDTALVANVIAPLHFTVTAPDSRPAVLEPYMGMSAHAMIARDDGSVFVHLHPMGTIAMAAQSIFTLRGDSTRAAPPPMPMASATLPDTVSFPYAFPKPGHYRIWVQVRRAGRVLTGTFDAGVR